MKRPRRRLQLLMVQYQVWAFRRGACIATLSVLLGSQHPAHSQPVSGVNGPSVNSRAPAEEAKPHFIDLLTDLQRKLDQQAQQAELLVKAQHLREEGEILLRSGEMQTASLKFDAALRLLETPETLDPSGILLQEFQYKLKEK